MVLDRKERTQKTQLACHPRLGDCKGSSSIKMVTPNDGTNAVVQTTNTRTHEVDSE